MPAALQRLHLKGSRPVWAFFNILSMLFVRLAEWSHCKEGRVCPCLPAALQKVDPRRAVVRLTGPYSVVHCAAMHPTQQLEMSQCCWLAQCGGPHRRGCLGDPHAQRGACSTLDANEAQRFPCASGHGHAINCEKSKERVEEWFIWGGTRWDTVTWKQRRTKVTKEKIELKYVKR